MIITLLLIAAAVYFLWFHKFKLEDGTEVKGFIAKYKAGKGEGDGFSAPVSDSEPSPVPPAPVRIQGKAVCLKSYGDNKLAVVKAIKDYTTLSLTDAMEAAGEVPVVFIHNLSDEEADRIIAEIKNVGGEAAIETDGKIDGRYSGAQYKEPEEFDEDYVPENSGDAEGAEDLSSDLYGLDIESEPEDFDRVFQEGINDLFGCGWDALEAVFGWLLLGYTRDDKQINRFNAFPMISDYYAKLKDALYDSYKEGVESGEYTEEQLRTFPTLMANVHLLNGFRPFSMYASQYLDPDTLNRINDWIEHFNTVNVSGQELQEKPVAAEELVRVYTILKKQDDSMIEPNRDMFMQKYKFDFELPA